VGAHDPGAVFPAAAGGHARPARPSAGQRDPGDGGRQRSRQPLRPADAPRFGARAPHRRSRRAAGVGPGLGGAALGVRVRGARQRRAGRAARRVAGGRRALPHHAAHRDRRRAVAAGGTERRRRHAGVVEPVRPAGTAAPVDAGALGSGRPRRPAVLVRAGVARGGHGGVAGVLPVHGGVRAAAAGHVAGRLPARGRAAAEAGGARCAGARPGAAGREQVAGAAAQLRRAGAAPHPATLADGAAGTRPAAGRRGGRLRELLEARGLHAGYAQPADLEEAMLDVWALSEGTSPERIAQAGMAVATEAATWA
jgi:hypothetical protein